VAFQGVQGGANQVYLRRLDQLEAIPLRGTEGTVPLGFSVDGQFLLVGETTITDGLFNPDTTTLRRISVAGGTATTVAEGFGASTWGPDDTLVLTRNFRGLQFAA
jgi:hypothetical protein